MVGNKRVAFSLVITLSDLTGFLTELDPLATSLTLFRQIRRTSLLPTIGFVNRSGAAAGVMMDAPNSETFLFVQKYVEAVLLFADIGRFRAILAIPLVNVKANFSSTRFIGENDHASSERISNELDCQSNFGR